MASLARLAADAIGAYGRGRRSASGARGRLYTIEVNAVPGWQALARVQNVDIARHVLEYTESLIREGEDEFLRRSFCAKLKPYI